MKINKFLATVLAFAIVAISIPFSVVNAADEYVYGTLSYLTYGEYFSSELGSSAAVSADSYDTITSATTSKFKSFINSAYTTDSSTGITSVYGIKDVPVRIDKSIYDAAVAGTNVQVKNLLDRGFIQSANPQSVYKVVNSDATLSAYVGLANTDVPADAKSSISTDTNWGNYIVYIYPNDNSSLDSGKNIEGAYMTTTEGKTYPIYHLANLWFQAYEFSWVTQPDFTEPHGNKPYTASLTSLTGKNIDSVTYIYKTTDDSGVATFSKYTYDVGSLKVKTLLGDSYNASSSEANAANNNNASVTLNVPAGTNYQVSEIESLSNGTDYTVTPTASGFNIKFNDGVLPGSYKVTLTDNEYEDIRVEVIKSANISSGDIVINNNALEIKNNNVGLNDFLNALSKATLKVDGKIIKNGAKVLFNNDGTVNLNAKTTGRGAVELFTAEKDYDISLEVPGYGMITGKVSKKSASGSTGQTGNPTVLNRSSALDMSNSQNDGANQKVANNQTSKVLDGSKTDKKSAIAPKTGDRKFSVALIPAGVILLGTGLAIYYKRKMSE